MTNGSSMKLLGGKEFAEKLSKIADEMTAANTLEAAGQAGALPVINIAKQKVRKKTRTLSRSIHQETVIKTRSMVEIQIGTDVVYARIHEFGGTITPKKGKYLAIPVSSTAKSVVSPRNFSGDLHMAGRTLRDSAGTVHWILVTSTTIVAQPYMRPGFDQGRSQALDDATTVLRSILEKVAK